MRIRKSKDRQHNGQKKKDKSTNNDLHKIAQKTKDRVTRTPLKTGVELRQGLQKKFCKAKQNSYGARVTVCDFSQN